MEFRALCDKNWYGWKRVHLKFERTKTQYLDTAAHLGRLARRDDKEKECQ